MPAITVYNTMPYEAIHCQPFLTVEDENKILEWLGLSTESDLAQTQFFDSLKAEHVWIVRNPRTNEVSVVSASDFTGWETAQQWEDSTRAAVDAIAAEVTSWPEGTYQREFLLHIIKARGGK